MKKDKVKSKFIEQLRETPIIKVVCDRVGISRNSVYEWRKQDLSFVYDMDEALGMGVDLYNDAAESLVLKGISNGDINCAKFWLNNRHKKYIRPLIINRINQEDDPDVIKRKTEEAIERYKKWQDKWFEKPKKLRNNNY